jgi:hypothetical protein
MSNQNLVNPQQNFQERDNVNYKRGIKTSYLILDSETNGTHVSKAPQGK